jgi:hypothetical protein
MPAWLIWFKGMKKEVLYLPSHYIKGMIMEDTEEQAAEFDEIDKFVDTEEESEDITYSGGDVKIPIATGHEFSFNTKGGKMKGKIPEKEIKPKLPALNSSIDIPIIPGVHVSAGLEITPTLNMKIGGGGYMIKGNEKDGLKAFVKTAITGTMNLEVILKAGAGVGVANLITTGAGVFGSLTAASELKGSLKGDMSVLPSADYNVDIHLNAENSIKGKAGAYLEASILTYKKEAKFPIGEVTLGEFIYNRHINVSNGEGLSPQFEDFYKTPTKVANSKSILWTDKETGKQEIRKYQKLSDMA